MSGEPAVKSQCFSFAAIPHTTPLFSDFLAGSPKVKQFYPRPPQFRDWFKDEAAAVVYDAGRRDRVAAILERQNRNWGASAKTLNNVARLRSGAFAIVTGQQVGLLGGPLYSVLKALTVVKLAAEATAAGLNCVPVFWMATEDHDLEEVSHVTLLGPQGALHKLVLPTEARTDAPVGTVTLDERAQAIVEGAAGLLGETEAVAWLRECYRPGATLGDAFARLFTRLFSEFGLIFLDPADARFHAICQPVYRAAIERSSELNDSLLQRGKALETAGYHQQVKVTGSSTLLFLTSNGRRVPVQRRNVGSFVAGQETLDQKQLLDKLVASPQDFSANVLLRPVIQDYLLPTLAYAAGAAEVAYFAQAEVVYRKLLGRVTPILPRLSATIIEAKAQSLLKKYDLSFSDVFRGPEKLQEELASRTLPEKLQAAFEDSQKSLSHSLESVKDALGRLDVTLVEAALRGESKMRYQLQRLQGRAARAELRRNEQLRRHAELLGHELFPQKTLQEREIGGIHFLSRYGAGWLQELSQALQSECLDHQIISL